MNFNKTTTNILLLIAMIGAFWSLLSGNLESVIGWVFSFMVILNISETDMILSWTDFDEDEKTVTLQFSHQSEVSDFTRTHKRYDFPEQTKLQSRYSGPVQATYTEKSKLTLSEHSSLNSNSEEIT